MFALNQNAGDLGFAWRMQGKRSMDQLDNLHQYKLSIGGKLDEDKRAHIEGNLDLYADADQFRIHHAKGRFRGIISATIFTSVFFNISNGGRNGKKAMGANPLLASLIFGGSLVTFYTLWSRYAGFTNQKYNEFQYARVHKMLRNIQVKQ